MWQGLTATWTDKVTNKEVLYINGFVPFLFKIMESEEISDGSHFKTWGIIIYTIRRLCGSIPEVYIVYTTSGSVLQCQR